MFTKTFYLVSAISLLFYACKPAYTTNPVILKAETLLFTNPDSAYKLLNSISQPQNLPEADYAAWCLHYTFARYKLYIDEKSDSLIRFASAYYQKNGPDKYAGTALYLQGCFAVNKMKTSEAMMFYKKAISILEKTDEHTITGLVYYRICNLYLQNEFYSEADRNIDKAIFFYKKAKANVYLYYAYRTKAECLYRQRRAIKDIIRAADTSEKLALENKDSAFYYEILTFKGKINIDSNTIYAKQNFLKVNKNKKFNHMFNNRFTDILLTYTYSTLQMPDSAKFYLEKSKVDSTEMDIVLLSEIANSHVNKSFNNFRSALFYQEKAYVTREKLYTQNNKELLVRIDKQFDYNKKEQQRAQLEIANQQKIILIITLCALILAGIIVHLKIQQIHKQKQNKLELERQSLNYEIQNRKRENEQNIKILQSNIKNKIENTLKFKRLNIGLIKQEKIDDFIAEITQQSVVSEKELHLYMVEADKLYGNRISSLKINFPQLTFSDLVVISLISLGIDFNNCCILLDISLNTLYTRRKRIKKHLGIDKSIELEQWVNYNIVGD